MKASTKFVMTPGIKLVLTGTKKSLCESIYHSAYDHSIDREVQMYDMCESLSDKEVASILKLSSPDLKRFFGPIGNSAVEGCVAGMISMLVEVAEEELEARKALREEEQEDNKRKELIKAAKLSKTQKNLLKQAGIQLS